MSEASMSKWIQRWGTIIAETPSKPGVWRRKEGGFVIRSRIKHPRTGQMKEIRHHLVDSTSPEAAFIELQRRIDELRSEIDDPSISIPSFGEFAASLLEGKVEKGEIKRAQSRERWDDKLGNH